VPSLRFLKKKNKKSSPSAFTPPGEAFPECVIFSSRGRRLHREMIPEPSSLRVALGEGFPECNWSSPRVQLAPGEDPGSHGGTASTRVHAMLVPTSSMNVATSRSMSTLCSILCQIFVQSGYDGT
jgi:hypothetical protein